MIGRIMIADGSAVIRKNIAEVLSTDGFDVIEAEDGNDALRKIRINKIDIIICELNMVPISGIGLVKKLNFHAEAKKINRPQVIMMLTDSGEARRSEARDAGVNLFITKPFAPYHILDAVWKLL